MITSKIKFTPEYARDNDVFYADGGVEVENLTPELVWRNLTNVSIWPRLDKSIVDAGFEDVGQSDPHLYDKAQFYLDLAGEQKVRANVIYCVGPKDDRAGKLAYEATVFGNDGQELYTYVAEFVVGVPDKNGVFDVMAAISGKLKKNPSEPKNLGDELLVDLQYLADWSRRHH